MANDPHIVVAGAGTLGCFVGGVLAAAGRDITLLTRPRIAQEIRAHGLTLTDFRGMAHKVDADALALAERPDCFAQADIILLTVRSSDTPVLARMIAAHAAPDATIISLQDGAENIACLHEILPDYDLRAGIVPFTVAAMGQGCFHRATPGDIMLENGRAPLTDLLSLPDVRVTEADDIPALQWGQFLHNLNDALNALSGLTLREQLQDRAWRKLISDQWAEGLQVLKASQIKPSIKTPVPASLMPTVLKLPTPMFTRLAAFMLQGDAQARSRMSYDLIAGRKTEIQYLQGRVVEMGRAAGVATPISAMVVDIIKLAETAGEGLPHLPVSALRRELLD